MKKVITLCLSILIISSFGGCGKSKKVDTEKEIVVESKIEILQEKKIGEIESKNLYLEYDYEIKNIEIKNEILEITVDSDVNSFEGAYALGKFISEYVKEKNNAKIDLYGVNSERVIFKTEKEQWLYDGTDIIKIIE
ncbi:MAG: hypothetical protein ACRC6T_01190 [Sarcina sp.]